MTDLVPDGILRAVPRIASTTGSALPRVVVWMLLMVIPGSWGNPSPAAADSRSSGSERPTINELESYVWDFGRSTDKDFDFKPDGWKQYRGVGYPGYVKFAITARDPDLDRQLKSLDTKLVAVWQQLRKHASGLPFLPPSVADALVNRYLRIDLDGGQFKIQSPGIVANRIYQYRFSCQIMTQGLRHDSARAEFVFLDKAGNEIGVHSTPPIRGTTPWTTVSLDLVRPPIGAVEMMARLIVQRSEEGLEDIRGAIGFDEIRIDQYPQLQVSTDQAYGIYAYGQPVLTSAKIMGLPAGASEIRFELFDSDDHDIATKLLSLKHITASGAELPIHPKQTGQNHLADSEVSWKLLRLDPGYYRVAASIESKQASTLATETTFAVVDPVIGGPPHGSFGWTLPEGAQGISPRDLASWLSDLGVAWVKYPCWLAPEDTLGAEEVAAVFSKLQDAGIQTVGMLDVPPEAQVPVYDLRGRRDMVAAQLFRDVATWQPLLDPVMTRLTLKVRTWQLGADRDHSFLGRPRLQESISQISTGLQGFGQPIDVAISWPWLEPQLGNGETSWQAVCRSSDPPLSAQELDAFLTASEKTSRGEGARTWLLLDPISKGQYDRDSRIRDLVLRMAMVRSHRVQAAFVSNPHDGEHGLLEASGRPAELLLPWRTTSRLIGNLRKVGSLQLRSGAENSVFVGSDRAVLMLWSAEPTEELIYLGQHAQAVDVWGKVTDLTVEPDAKQPFQRVKIGPLPTFIVGADPTLLAFRMSVALEQQQLDSLIGEVQKLKITFTNPMRDSLVGDIRVLSPKTWMVEGPTRSWEMLPGRSTTQSFDVVLSSTAEIGTYELPIQFELETVPSKLITVYRKIVVGPEGLDLNATTRLLRSGDLRVQIEITNRTAQSQSYSCILFPPPGRQYQRRFLVVKPGESIRREIYWPDGAEMIGKRMLLRADEQDGRRRVLNYSIEVAP